MSEEPLGTIVVCCGPPDCELLDEDAVKEQEAGCPLCKRIDVMQDGTEREYTQPTN